MSVKRKLTNPSRHFSSLWEEEYLFVKDTSKPQYLVCLQIVLVPKEYNLKRITKHAIRVSMNNTTEMLE